MPKQIRSGLNPAAIKAMNRPTPVIVDRGTINCRIRTLKPAEVDQSFALWLTDPAVQQGLNTPTRAMGMDAFKAYVASFDNIHRGLLGIWTLEGRPAGLIRLDIDLRHKLASIHLIIGDPDLRRQHLAFGAVRLLIWHLFLERDLAKVMFEPLARNEAAVAACRGALLRQEATLVSHRLDAQSGERLDQLIFSLTRAEFEHRVRTTPALPEINGPGLATDFVERSAKRLGRG
jgi:RimJ/RimL family protein N-acetyltransferase